jgi:uncharacterized delta-60 repeat protein
MTRTIPHGCRALVAACALALVTLPSAAHARFGDLDPAFDGDGLVTPSIGTGSSRFEAIAARPDGRPVAAGYDATQAIVVQRTLDGSADTSFGAAGVVSTALATRLHGVALDATGRVLAAGALGAAGQATPRLLRMNADGGSPAGFTIGPDAGEAHAVLPLPDGRTLVAGRLTPTPQPIDETPFLARLDAAGALDQTFDADGFAEPAFGPGARALAVTVDAAGRIVIAGATDGQPALARYTSAGALDQTFDADGTVVLSGAGELRAVGVDGAGRIVAAGLAGADALVTRLLADGTTDATFGSGGSTRLGGAQLGGLAPDGDRWLVAGTAQGAPLLGALGAGGLPDAAFGGSPSGWRTLPLTDADAFAAAPGPGGTLYAAGRAGTVPLIARVLPNAAPAAALAGPDRAFTGAAVTLDAGGSSDPEGEGLRYAFDLDGDGSFEHDAGASPTATRAFPAPGSSTVGVRVTDPRGASAVATRAIAVSAAPAPILGKQGVARPLRGIVTYRLPGTKRFVRMVELTAIPNGTEIGARRGQVLITVVRDASGRLDSARFYGGRFVFRQAKGRFPITTLKLSGGTFAGCKARAAVFALAAAAGNGGKKKVRKLWGDGRGRFRTRGRYGAATVRGTKWVTQDRCDGTLVRVVRGRVRVNALGAPGATIVKAGQRRLVPARRGR